MGNWRIRIKYLSSTDGEMHVEYAFRRNTDESDVKNWIKQQKIEMVAENKKEIEISYTPYIPEYNVWPGQPC